MDKSVSPCNDFFQYACGGYINRNTPWAVQTYNENRFKSLREKNYQIVKRAIEAIKIKGSDNSALKKAAQYYSVCQQNSPGYGLFPYWQALKDVGGASIADKSWSVVSNTSWTVENALKKLHIGYGTYPIFKVTVSPNLKNTSQHILTVCFEHFSPNKLMKERWSSSKSLVSSPV